VAGVFVSHASKDLELARKVRQWLIEAGHKVFLAHDLHDGITAGEDWKQRLDDELRRADVVVCMVTSAYVASPSCTFEVSTAQLLPKALLPVQVELGVAHQLLESVQHIDLTGDRDAVPAPLITALRRGDIARFGRRFAQYTGIATGIAAVVTIAVNLLSAPHPPAGALAAPSHATAPVAGSPVSVVPPPNAASTFQAATQPGPMAPGTPPGQSAPSTGSLTPPHTNDLHRYSTPFQLANYWSIHYQYTRYQGRGVAADGAPPYPN
jgi:hypothetical protein